MKLFLSSLFTLSLARQYQYINIDDGIYHAYYLPSPTFTNITFRLCSNATGWLGIGFNPTTSSMSGSQVYVATQVNNQWEVYQYLAGRGRLPSTTSGPGVSDATDAAADCYSTIGVSFVVQVTDSSPGISTGKLNPKVVAALGLDWIVAEHQSRYQLGQVTFQQPLIESDSSSAAQTVIPTTTSTAKTQPTQPVTIAALKLGDSIALKFVPNEEQNSIQFTLCANVTGWIGIGFNPNNDDMTGAAILVFKKSSTWSVQSMYATGSSTPQSISSTVYPPSELVDATQQCASTAGVSWSRKIDSLTNTSKEFSLKGSFYIIYAWSSSNTFEYHGSNRGQTEKIKLVDASKFANGNATVSNSTSNTHATNSANLPATSSARKVKWFLFW